MFSHAAPRLSVPLPRWRPRTCLGPVERVYATELVSVAYDPVSVYPIVTARSVTTGKVRTLPALAALAHESMDALDAWLRVCKSGLVY